MWPKATAIILLLLFISFVFSYNQNPKIFVEVDCISFADPLVNGFNVILPKELFRDHLTADRSPSIYAAAVPLRVGAQADRKILYLDQLNDKLIHLEGLDEESWYFVCVEFENMHRMHRAGNTSTTCQRYRTLDKFGKTSDSFLAEVQMSAVRENSLEFLVSVATNFPCEFDAFLDFGSSAVQTFFVEKPKQILIKFANLLPGFNYGRLCIQEKPLRVPFSAMGRPIFGAVTKCYFNDLKTEIPNQIDANSIDPNSNQIRSLPVTGSATKISTKIRQYFGFLMLSTFLRFF